MKRAEAEWFADVIQRFVERLPEDAKRAKEDLVKDLVLTDFSRNEWGAW